MQVICGIPDIELTMVEVPLYYYFERRNSAIHMIPNGEWISFCQWYLDQIDKVDSNMVQEIYLLEALKRILSVRYINLVSTSVECEVSKKCCQLICTMCFLYEMTKACKKKASYGLFIQSPSCYLLFRIVGDFSLLKWERMLKRKDSEKSI